jgi:hypothetical protein
MEYDTSTLILLAEVSTAFVAFAVIVSSIRVSLGHELSQFNLLLVHFFTESGMLATSIALVPLVLLEFQLDQLLVATLTTWFAFFMLIIYLSYYLRRRIRINVPTPLLSVINIIVWAGWVVVLGMTLSNIYWGPSLAIVAAMVFWGICSGALIFMSFLSDFLIGKT